MRARAEAHDAHDARSAHPLRLREFRLYFTGNVVSNIGNWMQNVVLAVFMFRLTGGSTWVGIVSFALFVPGLIFTLPGGAIADRYDRLRLLMLAQIGGGVLATLLTVLAATGTVNRWWVVAIAFGIGVFFAFAIPAMQSLLPLLVPEQQMDQAIALNAVTFNVARAVGPLVASAALVVGATWAFAINALSFYAMAFALWRIRRVPFPRAGGAPGRTREAVRYAWTHVPTRTMLFAVGTVGITLDPITTLAPAYGRMLGNDNLAGWIVSAWGFGAVALVTIGAPLLRRLAEHGLGWLGLVVLGAGIAGFAGARNLPAILGSMLVAGFGYIAAAVIFTTAIQRDVPERFRGRVMALWSLAFLGTRPVASIVDGLIADATSPHWAALVFATPVLVAAFVVRRGTVRGAEPVPPAV